MAKPNLLHESHTGITFTRVGDELRAAVTVPPGEDGVGVPPGGSVGMVLKKATGADHDTEWATEAAAILEAVAGASGFAAVSGTVTLDLDAGRAFHHEMVGNITSVTIANTPDPNAFATAWTWVLRIDTTGGYTLASTPSVTWVDGSQWADVNLAANAINVITFWRIGGTTYAALLTNGDLARDPYKLCYLVAGSQYVITERESIDVPNITKSGSGTLTVYRNESVITTRTDFDLGDVLRVACATPGAFTAVRVPRFAR